MASHDAPWWNDPERDDNGYPYDAYVEPNEDDAYERLRDREMDEREEA